MKALVFSDTHFDFHTDRGNQFISQLTKEVDLVIIAGDIDNGRGLRDSLKLICKNFSVPVIYVNGNHDFYSSSRPEILQTMAFAKEENSNLIWLDNTIETINGQRFLGTPLWFEDHPMNVVYQGSLNDFKMIRDYSNWVYNENAASKKFLADNIKPGDVVITHNVPHIKSISVNHRGSALTRFFFCDMTKLIANKAPKVFIHGHTHNFSNYKFKKTNIVCNPLGYPGEPTKYKDNLIIDL